MNTYPKYKDSGFDWIGEIPDRWETRRFRYLFRESAEKIESEVVGPMLSVSGYRGIEVKEYDDENRRRMEEDLIGYRVVRAGQLVVNTMWLNYAGLGVSDFEGHVSPAYRSYWIDQSLHRKFIHSLLRSGVYVKGYTRLLTGIRPNSLQMSREDLMSFPVLVPPVDEQAKIASFLDAKTAQIDELIEKKRRQIELLKEYRASVISEAVTKGLNPNVRMKDSGVEWIGMIPEHWTVGWLKHLFAFEKGKNAQIYTQEFIADHPGEYPVFSGQTENEGVMGLIDRHEYDTKEIIFVTTVGARAMTTRLVSGKYALSQNCALIIPRREELSVRYYHGLLQMMFAYEKGRISLIMQPSLRFEDMVKYWAFIPPKEEQGEIAKFIVDQNTKIDFLLSKAESQIELLQSYRTSLISEAVTGKIDVRDWAKAS